MTAAATIGVIDTDGFSKRMRGRALDLDRRLVRITKLTGSVQERDLTEPVNCGGLGRIRHFQAAINGDWPDNPLPIVPAVSALGLAEEGELRAQVFQNAVCNWRCWYCYVDFDLLNGSERRSRLVSCDELVDLYLGEPNRARVIDLSGGQPDLVPEWAGWMIDALNRRGVDDVYVWSDDNLSNDYFFRYLEPTVRARLERFPRYGKVCCFKGFDETSFAFNTRASEELFERQFELAGRYLRETEIDLYCYVTLTTPREHGIEAGVSHFLDRLQELNTNLPLRTVPLEIRAFSPVAVRLKGMRGSAIDYERVLAVQHETIGCWQNELRRRFSANERALPIVNVAIRG